MITERTAAPVAIIGGTGLSQWPGLGQVREEPVETPYGAPAAPLLHGVYAGRQVIFLPRHGREHTTPPHRINYRANIWALRQTGVRQVLAVAAVGGIRADMAPGVLALPEQLIDYSWGRQHSFHDGGAASIEHVEFDPPYSTELRRSLLDRARDQGIACIDGGTYACSQGPRLETAAEVRRLQRDGCDVVGMTGMPEAALAREAGLDYVCLAVVVNWAAGLGPAGAGIHEQIAAALESGMAKCRALIQAYLNSSPG